jgi:hypothetical protein
MSFFSLASRFFRRRRRPSVKFETPTLTGVEKATVFRYAEALERRLAGVLSLEGEVRSIYRAALRRGVPIKGVHMLFLSEVDNPSPCLTLRQTYRRQILETEETR